ncbi:MAG: serine hydrolase, partial [Caldilinea sp.]|nr:serine hydrolase [Caldilinea sp.]
GWMIGEYGGHRVVGHAGIDLGYNAFMSLLPDDDMALIILANQSDAENLTSLPAFFMRDPILDILLGTTAAP